MLSTKITQKQESTKTLETENLLSGYLAHPHKAENQTSQPIFFETSHGTKLTLVPIQQNQWDSYEVYFCGICLGIVAQTSLGRWINSLLSINGMYSEPLEAAEALYQTWDFQQEQDHFIEVDGVEVPF